MTKTLRAPVIARRALMASSALVAASLAFASPALAQDVSLNGVDDTRTTFAGVTSVQNGAATDATLTLDLTSTEVFTGVLTDGAGSGSLGLTKIGSTGLTLTGVSDYTGSTLIEEGRLSLDGGSLLTDAYFAVGQTGTATFDVINDASVLANSIYIYADDNMFVQNASVETGYLRVGFTNAPGESGESNLLLDGTLLGDGWTLDADQVSVGHLGTGKAYLTIQGGARARVSSRFVLGESNNIDMTSILSITNGLLQTDAEASVGENLGSVATATITGADSRWTAQSITVGEDGTGTLIVSDGAVVEGVVLNVALNADGYGYLYIGGRGAAAAAGNVDFDTVAFGAGEGSLVFNHTGDEADDYIFAADVTGRGTLSANAGYTTLTGTTAFGQLLLNGGVLRVADGGSLSLADTSFVGASGSPVLLLDGAPATGDWTLDAVGTLNFNGGDGSLILQNGSTARIAGLNLLGGDLISVTDGSLSVLNAITLQGAYGEAARMVVSGADSQASAVEIFIGGGTRLGVLTISDQALLTTSEIRLRGAGGIVNVGAAEGEGPVAPGRLDVQRIVFADSGNQVVFNHTGDLTVDADISGTGGIVKLLAGRTTLSGTNTYTGETIFDGGTLVLGSDTALGGSTVTVTGAFQQGDPTITAVGGPRVLNNDIVFDRPGALPFQAFLTVDSSGHAVTLNGQVTGSGYLRVEGDAGVTLTGYVDSLVDLELSGLLRLETGLSFSDIYVTSGTLELGDGVNASPSISASGELTLRTGVGESAALDGSILLSDSLRFTTGTLTLNADIDGTGAQDGVVYVAGGDITFGGDNEFTGGLNVSGGRAVLNSADALAAGNVLTLSNDGAVVANHALSLAGLSMSGATSLELNADVSITSAGDDTIAGDISGTGGLAFDGGGRFILGGDNTYTGETILDDAILTLASDTALGGSTLRMTGSVLDYADGVDSAAPVIIDSDTSQFRILSGSATQSGVISELNGPRSFEKIGDGELVLTADNTWTGETTVSAGTLTFDGSSLDLVSNLVVSADGGSLARIVARGGAQISTDDFLIVGDTSDGELLIEDGAVVRSGTGFVGWRAGVTGTATITGGGSWDVGGLLSVGELGDGALTISEGATVISNHGKIGGASGVTGTVLVEGSGSLWTLLEPNIALEIGLVGSGSLTIADRGRVEVETVRIANHGSGDGVLNIGAAAGDDAVDAGVLDADQVIFGPGDGSIVFNHTVDNGYTFAADISGAGSVSALSGFTLFSGTHTYTGATTVSDAMLRIDGSLSNEGGLTVQDGGSLFGSGAIGGLTTVESGGSLGGATGLTLTFNDLVLQDGAVIDTVLFAPSETTLFDVAGDLTLDGTLNIADGGAFGQGVYRLFDYGGELYGDGLEIGDTGGANAAELTIQTAQAGQVNLVYSDGNLLFWDGSGLPGDGLIQGGDGVWTAASPNWTDADGNISGAMTPQPGFAVFSGTGGTVTAIDADGPLSVTGMQFMSDGYTLTGDAIALISPDAGAFQPSVLRVGDGTAAGVNMTAEIQNDLSAALNVVKTDLGELILSGTSVFDGALAVEGGGLTVRGGDVTTLGSLIVEGVGSESRLVVDGGGQVTAGGVSVGGDDGGAVLTVSGTGSRLDAGSLSIYGLGGGTVSVESGGRLHATSVIDANGQSPATLLVTGAGSLVTGENAVNLGTDSIGVMLVDDEGRVETVGGFLGLLDGAYGQATLQNGGVWAAEELFVGYMGEGHVQAFDRAALQIATGDAGGNGSLELGSLSGGYGILEVEGGFASIENTLWVGRAGDGIVDLGEDGVIQSGSAVIAEGVDSISQATINGGHWSNTGAFVVGQAGWGTLYAEAGGSLITGDAVLGEDLDSLGMAVITGAATSWFINGGFTIGGEGEAALQVRDGAVITGDAGRAAVGASSAAEIWLTEGGILNLDSLTLGEAGEGYLTLTDGGALSLAGGAGVLTLGLDASGYGALTIGGAGCGCTPGAPDAAGVLNAAEVVFGSGAGELYFNHTETDYTFAAELTGAGLVVALAGTTHLTGNSTDFTGQVFVAGADARLLVDGLLGGDPLSSLTVVSDGGRLGGSGTLDQYVAIDTGGILEGRSGQTLTLGDLMLGADGIVEASLGAPSADVLFDVTGDLTLDGELEIVDLGGFGAGLYGLFGYGGTLTDNGLDITSAPGGVNLNDLSLQITGDRVNLINLAGQTITFWDGAGPADDGVVDGGDGLWTAVTENWTNAAGTVNGVMDPTPGFAVFSGSAGTVTLDDAAGALSVTGLQFAVDGYELTGDALTLAEDADGNRRAVVRVGDGTAAGAAMTATIHSDIVSDRLLLKTDLGELVLTGDLTLVDDLRIQNGTLTLDGGTSVTDNDVRVADEPGDDGVLIIRNGAQLSNLVAEVGRDDGSRGEATVTGQGSVWNSGFLSVGIDGDGLLTIADRGRVSSSVAIIASGPGSIGEVTVAGAGSEWASDAELYVGFFGDAALTIADGATVSAVDVIMAAEAGSAGVINIGAAAGDEAEGAGTLDTPTLSFGNGAGELVFNHTDAGYAFGADINGAGSVSVLSGETFLTGDHTYTGTTTITGGTLLVDGTTSNGGGLTVEDAGTLGGAGSIGGLTTIAAGGVLSGVQGRTLGLGTLVLSEGSVVSAALGAADGAAALFDVAGDLTLDGELEVTDVGGFGAGVYRLFDYGGVLTDNGLDIALTPGVDPDDLLVQTSVANQVNLISTFDMELRFWDGAGPDYDGAIQGGDGTWSLTGRNWTGAAGTLNGVYDNPAFAVFMGTAGTVTVDGAGLGVTGMQFAVDGYQITGDGIDLTEAETIIRVGDGTAAGADMTATIASALTGAGGLVKTDLGVLILTGANTYEGGTVVLDGTLIGDAGSIAGDVVNDAVLVFDQGADADFAGALSGDGEAFKRGAGVLSLLGGNAMDWSIETGGLSGQAGAFAGDVDVTSGATFTLNADQDAAWSGVLSGDGTFTKTGAGGLALNGNSSDFEGIAEISEGLLVLNGVLGGELRVLDGAMLAGSGALVELTAEDGAVIAPGNSIGTLTVTGDVVFETGSIYEVEVDPTSDASDRIVAGGTATLNGGVVRHVGYPGDYGPESTYTILTAAGGVTGAFDAIETDFAFLDASLDYEANAVLMTLERNAIPFPAVGETFNQRSTGAAVEATQPGDPLYDAVVGQTADGARLAFDMLSGELHGSIRSAQSEAAQALAGTLRGRMDDARGIETGAAFWAQATGSHTRMAADGNAAALTHGATGLMMGADAGFGAVRLGVAGGAAAHDYDSHARAGQAEGDSLSLAAYGSGQWGALGLKGAVSGTWHEVETERIAAFPGFAEVLTADYDAETIHAFVEASWRVDMGPATTLEPFVSLARVRTETDGFTETGGDAALAAQGRVQAANLAAAGVGMSRAFDQGDGRTATLSGRLGWRHAWDDTAGDGRHAFAGSPTPAGAFTVRGLPVTEDALVAELGLDLDLKDRLSLTVDWSGQFSSDLNANALAATLNWRF